jgi:NADH dehydrogenase
MQQGRCVARQVAADLGGNRRENFHYVDKGSLATIGRAAAVAQFGKLHISGFLAWLSWLFIHILFLIGFRNRVVVMFQWAWSYLTYERSARLITGEASVVSVPSLEYTEKAAAHSGGDGQGASGDARMATREVLQESKSRLAK